jgi:hypothetical protein
MTHRLARLYNVVSLRTREEPLTRHLAALLVAPTADATIALTNGGKLSTAPGIHGLTAGLLVAAGFVLALG